MDLSNPFKIEIHYLLIGAITGFVHQDVVPMVSALVCIIYTLKKTTMIHGIIGYQVVMISPSYYIV